VSTPAVPDPGTAIELQRLRGDISTGFAEIKGSLALLVQRSDQTDRALGEHRTELTDLDKRVSELERARAADGELGQEERLRKLEASRWPWQTIAGLTAAVTCVLAILGALLSLYR
jgi:hypothetical protein